MRQWEWKLFLCFACAVVLLSAVTCFASDEVFKTVICPTDWKATIGQRIDSRDRWGIITKRRWVWGCV